MYQLAANQSKLSNARDFRLSRAFFMPLSIDLHFLFDTHSFYGPGSYSEILLFSFLRYAF